LAYLLERIREKGSTGSRYSFKGVSRSTYGMMLAHTGIGIFIFGVTFTNGYESTNEVRMHTGDTATVGEYVFQLQGTQELNGPNYKAVQATLDVTKNGTKVTSLFPEKRVYNVQTMPMTEAAIDTGLFRDLYVAMGQVLGKDDLVVRIQVKPMVDWIWFGCLLMALGGILAVSDRRYRIPAQSRRPVPMAVSSAPASN
jgi:cytochrome c-type biogenesis protein CcmF